MTEPDFVIIGAMKCGTSTLAAQLGAQEGIFITDPKEPNFFSDDANYEKGLAWYRSLFANAPHESLKGEASTHYTKLPTHPRAAERLHAVNPNAKLIYLTRDPVERIISHYIHEWTMGLMSEPLDEAIHLYPELIAYSQYDYQLEPWRSLFPEDHILVLSLEELKSRPQDTLNKVAVFLGKPGEFSWCTDLERVNESSQRIRRFPGYDFLVEQPVMARIRRAIVPKTLRAHFKSKLQMQNRPTLSPSSLEYLQDVFAEVVVEPIELNSDPGKG